MTQTTKTLLIPRNREGNLLEQYAIEDYPPAVLSWARKPKAKKSEYSLVPKIAGQYSENLLVFPSVTTILSTLNKPLLTQWAFGVGVKTTIDYWDKVATVEDFKAGLKADKRSFWHQQQEIMRRGSRVHGIFESWTREGFWAPSEKNGWTEALELWFRGLPPGTWEAVERPVFSWKHQFAGTLDAIYKIGDRYILVDLKTGKDTAMYPEYFLQLAAYKQAWQEMFPDKTIEDAWLVKLAADGSFKVGKCPVPYDRFQDVHVAYKAVAQVNNLMKEYL